jgi:hypothetical protein
MGRSVTTYFCLLLAAMCGACGYKAGTARTPSGAAGSGGGAGSSAPDASGAGGTSGAAGTTGAAGRAGFDASFLDSGIISLDAGPAVSHPDANCGALNKPAPKLPPDILILLDVSQSMNATAVAGMTCTAACGTNSKWSQMAQAIQGVVAATDTTVNWGLKFFADGDGVCGVGPGVAVEIGAGKSADIIAAVTGRTATNGNVVMGSSTPTRAGVAAAATYLGGLTDPNPKFILLATDGVPTCNPDTPNNFMSGDADGAVTAIDTAKTAGFPTFVVGVATSTDANADMTLSRAAVAGGHPRPVAPSYYPVTSTADLVTALGDIIGIAATCIFQVGPAPNTFSSVDHIDVYGDGTKIDRDATRANGWDYTDASHNVIEVFGPKCDEIKTATIENVTVTFQCLVS